ncbi:MetQ/NlpA family ABC transporter substrate-binding protein [Oceanobacillus alkalisoli]|uniref:MetQ/NlpA family ABC transporter substrate-binding protein n=1 Tax=Oceanobacillus alkalisoli TaxID=2925113 RepID=UPI001EF0B4F8|nr:MetQ/NlpA family ABC transporter substrate-binding protein [Oceanobacillus alkalisoli]MCF3942696.1 MetQ/NlpA family ABC transporter substrate-binding protein [Oceanobacillus alkalisoli]MCG5102668.1 MetQ/NlpA family ABC transporter substrate-binding protein [Oceanobacillus alkalisoli]
MKKILLTAILASVFVLFAACGGGSDDEAAEGLLEDGKLTVGVTAGPHEEILEKVKELAAEEDLTIEIVSFSDYVMPNVSLSEEELDLNSFQTEPFFDHMNEERGLDLVKVADTVTFPMGIYSDKITDIADLEDGASIALPSDPTNSGRALLLFEQAGLITLEEGLGVNATVNDIAENEHNYEFIELDPAQIPRQLGEVDIAAINSNFAMDAGLVPGEDSIFIEQDSTFVNLIAVRAENEDDPAVQQFIDIYQSEEVEQFVEETYQGSILTGW